MSVPQNNPALWNKSHLVFDLVADSQRQNASVSELLAQTRSFQRNMALQELQRRLNNVIRQNRVPTRREQQLFNENTSKIFFMDTMTRADDVKMSRADDVKRSNDDAAKKAAAAVTMLFHTHKKPCDEVRGSDIAAASFAGPNLVASSSKTCANGQEERAR